MFNIII